MVMGETYPSRYLSDYLGFVRRQWFVILLALVVGVLAAAALLRVLPTTYQSSASVLVRPTLVTGASTDARSLGDVNLDTEAQVVKSVPVSSAVKEAMGSSLTAGQLSKRVSISVPPNTTIMTITYEASTAAQAQKGAQTYAESYLDYQTQRAKDEVDAQLKVIDDKAATTDSDIQGLNKKLAANTLGPAATKDAQQTLRTLQRRSAALSSRRLPLETAATDAGSVIDSASLPSKPARPQPVLVGGSSIALLLLLGLLLAWVRDRRSGKIRRAGEVEAGGQVEVLGVVHDTRLTSTPSRRARRRRAGSSLQSYRQIVHAVQARLDASGASLVVAGVGLTTSAEEVARTLGAATARTGSSVLFVTSEDTGDTRSRGALGAGDEDRLSTTSLERAGLTVDGNVQTNGLDAYLAGHLSSSRLVLVSTPPMGVSADAQAVSPFVQLSVLVVETNGTTHAQLADALRQLHQVGVKDVAAIVFDGPSTRRARKAAKKARKAERKTSRSRASRADRSSDDATHRDPGRTRPAPADAEPPRDQTLEDDRVAGSKRRR